MGIDRARTICLAGLACWLTVGGLCPRPIAAAVVVIANRCDQTVHFTVEPGGQGTSAQALAPGQLIPLHVDRSVRVGFRSGASSGQYRLEPNTLQIFVPEDDGVQLKQASFSGLSAGPSNPNALASKRPGPLVIPVKILADDRHPALRKVWELQLRKQIEAASRVFQTYCGVRFQVAAVETWPARATNDFPELSEEFREKVHPDPGWLAIGVVGRLRAYNKPLLLREKRTPFFTHILLPELQPRFTSDDQLTLLIHELGHYLGAVRSPEPYSVMRSTVFSDHWADRSGNIFDPVNILVMNVVADELRASGEPAAEAVSRNARGFLQAVYEEVARAMPDDQEPARYAEFFRRPGLSEPRYLGEWTDGSRAVGHRVLPWHDARSSPKLAGRELFGRKEPIRWLMDTSLAPAPPPEQGIAFVGGDFLPGQVTAHHGATDSPGLQTPPYLDVVPSQSLDVPGKSSRSAVRVTLPWIERIVWQRVSERYQPRTLFLRDGRQLTFRSVRFAQDRIQLLLASGIRDVPLDEVAELHMARVDPWDAYFGQLAAFGPDRQARIAYLETAWGLRVTSSTASFQAASGGPTQDPANWYHRVQPAWSLDPLWVSHGSVRVRQYFLPHEVPLSRIEPSAARQQSDLGGPWTWQADRNVEGGLLESGGERSPWGFGVHAHSELEFPLPPSAVGFRTRFGLDQLAGEGGCVRAIVFLDTTGTTPLCASEPITGSSKSFETGLLTWKGQARAPSRLILQVASVHGQRPEGADPLEIRDHFDWLEPILELDPEQVQAEVLRRGKSLTPHALPLEYSRRASLRAR